MFISSPTVSTCNVVSNLLFLSIGIDHCHKDRQLIKILSDCVCVMRVWMMMMCCLSCCLSFLDNYLLTTTVFELLYCANEAMIHSFILDYSHFSRIKTTSMTFYFTHKIIYPIWNSHNVCTYHEWSKIGWRKENRKEGLAARYMLLYSWLHYPRDERLCSLFTKLSTN